MKGLNQTFLMCIPKCMMNNLAGLYLEAFSHCVQHQSFTEMHELITIVGYTKRNH